MSTLARRLWQQYEPIHDVTYFSDESQAAAKDLGLRGYWMGYFAFRAAPLGAVGPEVVIATFYNFAPARVRRALPDAWSYAEPEAVLTARLHAVDRAMRAVLGPAVESAELAEAAELAWTAARAADIAGRPLAAANQALPKPDKPHLVLWQAATVLREHRGDGHNAVLVSRGITPLQAHAVKVATGESDGELLRTGRGFTEDEWARADAELRERGWLIDKGLTEQGRREHDLVEQLTDAACAQPWQEVGERDSLRLLEILRPLAGRVIDSGAVPALSPVGVVRD
ncbi:MAG TPA: hypothetical protein VMB79_04310 [Jatrophihabitans sp.]|nr:hypothetical protein [Jatrophihabitans sp.]